MQKNHTTKQIANKIGVHPNTVRSYEKQGYISQVKRKRNGYRQYTEKHLLEMQLAWLLIPWPRPGGKQKVLDILEDIKNECFKNALAKTKDYLNRIEAEISLGKEACKQVEAFSTKTFSDKRKYSVLEACQKLDVTYDALRNWERNRLVEIPRYPNNYRYLTDRELSLLRIIRVLRKCGYSMLNILRMLQAWKKGKKKNLVRILDTPQEPEDLWHVSNYWLTTLKKRKKDIEKSMILLQNLLI